MVAAAVPIMPAPTIMRSKGGFELVIVGWVLSEDEKCTEERK